MWIATAAEMKAIEADAVALGVSLETLMENAGRAVFEVVQRRVPAGGSVAVVCGPGNNGGDGLVVARLAHEAGYDVQVFVAAESRKLQGLPNLQLERLTVMGVQPMWLSDDRFLGALGDTVEWDLVVDAVLGTGANREVKGIVAEAIEEICRHADRTLSIDVPSGLNADNGEVLGASVHASETVVLGMPKPYLFHGESAKRTGKWTVADIGLRFPENFVPYKVVRTNARLADSLLLTQRSVDSNKGENGHVLIVAGSRRYRGAAVLAALGALRAGAGFVTVAAIEPVIESVAAQVPEAILLPLPEESGGVAAAASDLLLEAQAKATSAVFGPGLTTNPQVEQLLVAVWSAWRVPSVIDADALNLVAQGVALPGALCFLTPHPGEAARLLKTSVAELQKDRFNSARSLAEQFRNPVLLKGAYSVFCHYEDRRVVVSSTGNPGMATAGMGDVLAGVTAALVKQMPVNLTDALWQAALLHGKAGDLAAEEFGGIGYSASDLAHFLPRARSILTT